jgi:hypothetical protein
MADGIIDESTKTAAAEPFAKNIRPKTCDIEVC